MTRVRSSKTILTNLFIVGLAVWFRYSDFFVDPLIFIVAIAAVNIGLRAITRGPLRGL